MNSHIKIFWRERYKFMQSFASISVFIIILGFIKHNIEPSIVWLFWCWHLLGIGSNFWHDELEDYACLNWLHKPYASDLVERKWYSFLAYNFIAWLIAWQFWFLITGFDGYLWLLGLIAISIPIMLGSGAFMASLSANFVGNTCLLNLTLLPILAPILIYGAGIFWQIANQNDPQHSLAGLLAIALLFIKFMPKLMLKGIQISVPEEL